MSSAAGASPAVTRARALRRPRARGAPLSARCEASVRAPRCSPAEGVLCRETQPPPKPQGVHEPPTLAGVEPRLLHRAIPAEPDEGWQIPSLSVLVVEMPRREGGTQRSDRRGTEHESQSRPRPRGHRRGRRRRPGPHRGTVDRRTRHQRARAGAVDSPRPPEAVGHAARVFAATLQCAASYRFADGQLAATDVLHLGAPGDAASIVGGSGAYRAAGGEVTSGKPGKGYDVDVLQLDG
jgi:hypothetical protein